MSDSGKLNKPSSSTEAPRQNGHEAFVPRTALDHTPSSRFARVEADRAAAAAQIGRSLRAWRKASGAAGNASIPQGGGPDAADEKPGAEVSDPSEPAEQEADATAEKVGDELHDGDEKKGKDKGKGGENGKAEAGEQDTEAKDSDGAAAAGEAGAEGSPEKEAKGEEKPAPIAAKLEGVGLKIHRAPGGRVENQVPGVFGGASNVNQPSGTLNEPGGTFTYTDLPSGDAGGKPTRVSTNIRWAGKDGVSSSGVVERSIKLEKDGTRTLVLDQAFLDDIPGKHRWVTSDGAAMVEGRGTPLHVYLTMRQMRIMGIQESDIGKQLKKVKASFIVNDRTIWDIARGMKGKQGTPPQEVLLASHTAEYAKNYIVQAGGVVTNVEVKNLNWRPMKSALGPGQDSMALCGVDANQPDTWVPSIGFDMFFEVGEKVPGAVPEEVKT